MLLQLDQKLLTQVTSVLLTSTVKYDSKSTTKSSNTLKSEITTKQLITIQILYKNLILFIDTQN